MRIPKGCHTKIVRRPSGQKFRVVLDACGRVIETVRVKDLYHKTRTSKRLNKTRKRIGLR